MGSLFDPGTAIYVAMAVALVVWLGIFALLWRLDGQAKALQRRLDAPPRATEQPAPHATLERRSDTDLRAAQVAKDAQGS